MSPDKADLVSRRWTQWRTENDLDEYNARWDRMAAAGQAVYGEADLIVSFEPSSVLDAGCGMGRVAIELARRGVDVVGVDLDDDLLGYARRGAPELRWECADLATMSLGRQFALAAMAGNVMNFCRPNDRRPIILNAARHLEPGGVLVCGFALERGREALTLEDYDTFCAMGGLTLEERWNTWARDPYQAGSGYAVSIHSRSSRPTPDRPELQEFFGRQVPEPGGTLF